MKIIAYRYNSICEPGYIAAFRALGIEVIECRHDDGGSATVWDRMEELAGLIGEHGPLFVFSINYFPFISMVCDRLHTLYVAVSVDCPVFEIYDESIRSPYNRVFLFDREQYQSVRDENPKGIFHLPLGADVTRMEEYAGPFEEFAGRERYDQDITLVGSLYNEKDSYSSLNLAERDQARFQTLMDRQRDVPGLEIIERELTDNDVEILKSADPGFRPSDRSVSDISKRYAVDSYFSDHLTVRDRQDLLNALAAALPAGSVHLFTLSDTSALQGVVCHGGVNSTTEMPRVFRRSRINLNPTMRAIRTGLPQRIWDVLASGGFLLTNAQEEIPENLTAGKHLETYENTQELIEKTRYYLSHEEERQEIARTGYLEVKQNHTILHRVAQMIRQIVMTEEAR
ncbi:MAG: glycosyltransferase [Lachnospiraceae bacterium]|nr:glycosyltransferase [Lachnospiraceae bacterium]